MKSQLDQGYTPNEVMNNIFKSPEFQQMTQASSGDNWAMNNGIMYNKSTGEYMDLSGNTWNKLNDNTLYNPATGQTMSIDGLSGISGGASVSNRVAVVTYTPA